jgi:hypothetical protein
MIDPDTHAITVPVVRVAVDLGDYTPTIDEQDADWHPVTYRLLAHHAATLDHRAERVTERKLERLTIELTNDEAEHVDAYPPATLELPATIQGLEAIIAILDHARDYLAQEDTR